METPAPEPPADEADLFKIDDDDAELDEEDDEEDDDELID